MRPRRKNNTEGQPHQAHQHKRLKLPALPQKAHVANVRRPVHVRHASHRAKRKTIRVVATGALGQKKNGGRALPRMPHRNVRTGSNRHRGVAQSLAIGKTGAVRERNSIRARRHMGRSSTLGAQKRNAGTRRTALAARRKQGKRRARSRTKQQSSQTCLFALKNNMRKISSRRSLINGAIPNRVRCRRLGHFL